ncbi:hypothetical protein SeMB42_g01695 [Synchytrium endobioticum]|uniref:Uncharacterized protein n=1 Tax=Synchytrium endobioticum TaxID=286115 RepID=A0A507D291_9FUNG|nr:hypothetical protein SeLEV6574_g03763 [Synchytrium endobioticum]TPX52027.1 hypothetical protein SeMB42_g01695 [Synchytrium endobioticum]
MRASPNSHFYRVKRNGINKSEIKVNDNAYRATYVESSPFKTRIMSISALLPPPPLHKSVPHELDLPEMKDVMNVEGLLEGLKERTKALEAKYDLDMKNSSGSRQYAVGESTQRASMLLNQLREHGVQQQPNGLARKPSGKPAWNPSVRVHDDHCRKGRSKMVWATPFDVVMHCVLN